MKLYYFESPNARRPCAVAKYLKSPVDFIHVNLLNGEHKQPEFTAINPNGKVPALEDGETRLWESTAIMAYLAESAGSKLWPNDPQLQIEILKWLNWDTAHFSRHASRLWFENFVKGNLVTGEPNQSEIEDATDYFKQFAAVLDNHLKGQNHILNGGLTIADFSVATFLAHSQEAMLPLDGFDEIHRWYETMVAIDAWRDPWPTQPRVA